MIAMETEANSHDKSICVLIPDTSYNEDSPTLNNQESAEGIVHYIAPGRYLLRNVAFAETINEVDTVMDDNYDRRNAMSLGDINSNTSDYQILQVTDLIAGCPTDKLRASFLVNNNRNNDEIIGDPDHETLPFTLSHLTKREFFKLVEHHFPTELSVVNLRETLSTKVRAIDQNALKGNLMVRTSTGRTNSHKKYVGDCFLLQKFIDGNKIIDLDMLIDKTVKNIASHADSGLQNNVRKSVQVKSKNSATVTGTSQSSSKKRSKGTCVSIDVPIKRRHAAPKKKSNIPTIKTGRKTPKPQVTEHHSISKTKRTSENLRNTIQELRTELELLKAAMRRIESERGISSIETNITPANELTDTSNVEAETHKSNLTYKVSESDFTHRGGLKLECSDGNFYTVKIKPVMKDGVVVALWRCSKRFRKNFCKATVKQIGDSFKEGRNPHTHDFVPTPEAFRKGVDTTDLSDINGIYRIDIGGGFLKDFKYECILCKLVFMYRTHLQEHGREFHNGKTYFCELCNGAFKDYANYKQHMLSAHTDIRPFLCRFCSKRFSSNRGLMRHEYCHGPKPKTHICDECGKRFHSRDILVKHRRIHSGDVYLCNTCGKMFKTKNYLKMHVNTHTRARVYPCKWCDKDFTHSTHLLIHERRKHTMERPYLCNHCEKAFVSFSERKTHERVHSKQTESLQKPCKLRIAKSSSKKLKRVTGTESNYKKTKSTTTTKTSINT